MSQVPPPPLFTPHASTQLRPHRGSMVLVFGILGLVLCLPFGIAAWAMASSDLSAMRDGLMDPSGRDTTNAGRILGIISVCLHLVGLLIGLAFFVLVIVLGIGAAAAANGHHP